MIDRRVKYLINWRHVGFTKRPFCFRLGWTTQIRIIKLCSLIFLLSVISHLTVWQSQPISTQGKCTLLHWYTSQNEIQSVRCLFIQPRVGFNCIGLQKKRLFNNFSKTCPITSNMIDNRSAILVRWVRCKRKRAHAVIHYTQCALTWLKKNKLTINVQQKH